MAEDKSCSMGNKVDHTSDQPCEVSYQYIKEITKDYDEGLIVGNGAFGTVYKGICKNGEEIAIKVLKNMSGIDNKEFQLEFENLRRLKHQNVVKLVGFCNEPEKVLVEHNGNQVVADKMHTALCFEYVHNGSLAKHIPDVGCSGLNWHMLYKIIKGFCQGLEYLRHGLEFSVWHLDLKPANVLLDNNMIPKIADFGLSRLLGDENTRKTISSVGTRGYLPPEYIERGLITKEFDILSLGVIIAKLMAGREDYSKIDSLTEKRFIKLVHENWRRKLRETLAPRQLEVYCEQVKICIRIAVQCMSRNRQERPTIQSIVTSLTQTEKLIGKPGLQREQFRLEEPSLRKGSIYSTSPEMVAEATRGKTEKGKASTVSTEKKESPLQLLKKITNDFSDERIIGQDSLGILYKGILEDGEVIAVKKLAAHSTVHYNSSFIHEMENMMAVKHENTVQMVGFCREKHKKVVENNGSYITADVVEGLLCYEYLPKGSLRKNLFEESSSTDWETCFKIIKGICQGLHFLHSMPIGHVNLRTGNIYLDNKMRPKIAGFGYSRLIGSGNEPVHQLIRTGRISRTGRTSSGYMAPEYLYRGESSDWSDIYSLGGYMAPEYLYRGESSDWSDIYSLGVLIIKISTRERNCDNIDQISERTSFESVRKTWTDEYIMSKYPSLHEGCLKQISACIQIGLRCVEFDRYKRPSMQNIVDRLHEISNIGSNSFLCLQSPHINFPIGPKRLTYSSVYLMNSTDDHIAFRLGTKIPRRYLTKLPFCGIVPPNCTYTLNVIMHKQKRPPPLDSDDSLTLQESIARRGNLDNVDPASVALFLDTAGDKVREVKVGVACEPLAETISNQIIDAQNYREVLSIDVHPTEPWILTSNQRGYVCIWNYQTQAEVNSVEVTREPVYSAKFIEREEWFVVGSGDGCIYVYNYNTMEEVDMIEAHDSHCIMCLAVNPTHSFVLSASDDHKIKLWDWTNEWQCTRTFDGHYGTVTQVMFNPRNSESFSSASLDHTVKIWNIRSETCNITWEGHPEGLLCLHYHPRYFQQFLISGSSDCAVKVWDLETDTCVDTLQGHREGLGALCWHPELRVIVTGSLDGTVQIWKSTSTTYRLENIIGLNLGAVNALGYLKGLTRIVVGCDQGIALMEINVL